ncbi:MAG TPA: hypothetical protein DEH78_18485, partial [Solibacterales bacterium]|nr:hypothetical protein [Bryobacterales bacterium]
CDGGSCAAPGVDRRHLFRLAGFAASVAGAVFQPLPAAQLNASAGRPADPEWPTLRRYTGERAERVLMPVGGVGTGCVSLAGNGALRDWEVVNRPAKGFTPVVSGGLPFFALWVGDGAASHTRVLEGPLPRTAFEGSHGSQEPSHSLPRFASAAFDAAWPLASVTLDDPGLPVRVVLRAFSPFVPTDAEASGWPMAVLRYRLQNLTTRTLRLSVCGTLPNFVGMDGWETARDWKGDRYPSGARKNRNRLRNGAGVTGLFLDSEGVDPAAEAWGSLALAVTGNGAGVTSRLAWTDPQWGGALLDFWDDFSADGALEPRAAGKEDAPVASLAQALTLGPKETREVTFLIAWHFPNRYTWNTPEDKRTAADRIGNYHTTRFADAWDVVEKAAPQLAALTRRTVRFVGDLLSAQLPDTVKEAALWNASTLVSQTCFRLPDGHLFGWEGTADSKGCCHGSCTHVWNYEQTTPFLFGDLSWGMREVEFAHATGEEGLMSFRVHLPLERARQFDKGAADGQMGCVMKAYRDWQLSGDDARLRALWPHIRRAMEFCWVPGGWDADRDGVMEGAQHNTMDVEYYGPNPQMGFWYLGALRAAELMARHVGDGAFGDVCAALYRRGSAWIDAELFNGEYYEQRVQPPGSADRVHPKLLVGMGGANLADPDFQLAKGCLVDQLVGQ